MSDWNQLETDLHSWTPRRPSRELKKRIFVEPLAESASSLPTRSSHRKAIPTFNWLAPAAACCLTLLTLFGANTRMDRAVGQANPSIFAVAMSSLTSSNPTATVPTKWFGLSAMDENLEWNVWARASFDWTNEGQFLSTNRSLQVAQTNYLMR